MMLELMPILAKSDDDYGKFIGLIVFALIWIIGGLLSQAKKQKKKPDGGERSWEDVLRDLAGGQAPKPPAPQQTQRPKQQQRGKKKRQRQAPPPLPPPLPESEPVFFAPVNTGVLSSAAPETAPVAAAQPKSARATSIAQLLKGPGLRQQMIVKEILSTPVGLRE